MHLYRKFSKVISSHCSCLAGNSSYSNHIMAMLYEIANYSLHSLTSVPLELACTSKIRQWVVPGEKYCRKASVMETIIQKRKKSRGITCTLYDLRRNKDLTVLRQSSCNGPKLQSNDSRIGFSHCNFFMENDEVASTDFGVFPTGSTVVQQLNPVEFDIKFLVNIEKSNTFFCSRIHKLTSRNNSQICTCYTCPLVFIFVGNGILQWNRDKYWKFKAVWGRYIWPKVLNKVKSRCNKVQNNSW